VGRHVGALGLAGVALAVTKLLEPWLEGTVLPPSLGAVLLAASLGGRGPGLVAAAASTLGLKYFFLPEVHSLVSFTTGGAVRLALFVALAFPGACLAASLRSAIARLERAVQSRNDVLAIVSHDLRNPLMTITGQADLLDRRLAQRADAEDERKRVQKIQANAWRMERLIADLLDFASIEAGRLSIARADWPVDVLVDEALQAAEIGARAKGIRLVRVGGDDGALSCDRQRVLQALENLLGNAVKFTPEGGRIELAVEATPTEIGFVVRDSGPGIAAEHLAHLFDRYWKGSAGDHRGAGLGLAIVRGIIEAHGGRIFVDSAVGAGSRFVIRLPRGIDHRGGAPAQARRPDASARMA
jgi:signal transduction histidine kinase